jgi:hypothetical protein
MKLKIALAGCVTLAGKPSDPGQSGEDRTADWALTEADGDVTRPVRRARTVSVSRSVSLRGLT